MNASTVSRSDPVHTSAVSRATWSKGNVGEAFPGLFTPLSWDVVHRGTELGLRAGFRSLGALAGNEVRLPDDVDERIDAVFHGRVVGNLDVMRAIADRIPGVTADQIEQQLLGTTRDGTHNNPTRRRYPVIAVKMPVAVALAPARMRRLAGRTATQWRADIATLTTAAEPELRSAWAAGSALFREALALHTVISMIASGLYEQLDLMCRDVPDVEVGQLVTGYGGVDETRIVVGLWEASRGRAGVEDVIASLGFHCADAGQLHAASWRENPAALRELVSQYAALPDSGAPAARVATQRRTREAAEARLLGGLGRGRTRARVLLRLARRYIVSREQGKAAYLQAFDILRAATRRWGVLLVERGVLDTAEDVVFLTERELLDEQPDDARELVALRREQRETHRHVRLPYWWQGAPPTCAPPETTGPITGIGACGGVVEGLARVVHDPEHADLEPGEILVCATSDPSWMALFLPAAAVVIDIGGQVSHGAIAARELGVPCVVGTGLGTTRIKTGDRIRVDGSSGAVDILASPSP